MQSPRRRPVLAAFVKDLVFLFSVRLLRPSAPLSAPFPKEACARVGRRACTRVSVPMPVLSSFSTSLSFSFTPLFHSSFIPSFDLRDSLLWQAQAYVTPHRTLVCEHRRPERESSAIPSFPYFIYSFAPLGSHRPEVDGEGAGTVFGYRLRVPSSGTVFGYRLRVSSSGARSARYCRMRLRQR
jgi:hypothetical protein